MATSMTIDGHIRAIRHAASRMLADVGRAGEEAAVPTCPSWDVRDLLAHVIMVHDWAAPHVLNAGGGYARSETELRESGDELSIAFRRGVDRLTNALAEASDGLKADVFLLDAPSPRAFWARRQAHETTIHSVDAAAARLGRMPRSEEVSIASELALDGIDELLRGFVPRGHSHWDVAAPVSISVRPDDSERRWRLSIDAEQVRAESSDEDADVVLRGTAAQLYLGLWNRGDEIIEEGGRDALHTWRAVQRVHW